MIAGTFGPRLRQADTPDLTDEERLTSRARVLAELAIFGCISDDA